MKALINRQSVKKLFWIMMGTLIYAAGIGLFLDPNSLAPGGVVGISVILSHTFFGATGTWYFLLNIPIVFIGYRQFGKSFISYTFIAIILNSLFTNVFAAFPVMTDNLLTAAVAGSILVGTGLSLVFKAGATTGGMDIIIKLLRKRHPELKTSTLFVIMDGMVAILTGVVFGDFDLAVYSFITAVLNGKVMDYILYGADEARLIYIISDRPLELLSHILKDIRVGATIIEGKGGYSSRHKDILLCVVKKRQAPKLFELVRQSDPDAFMVVGSANEIYGEGYKNIRLYDA